MTDGSIRIAAFDDRRPRRGWVVDGMQVCTYANRFGQLNGYVRLPATHPDLLLAQVAELMPGTPFVWPDGRPGMNYPCGYDYIDVPCPGGWSYGPDFEGWIGFDTGHAWDHWLPEDRLAFCEDEEDRRRAEMIVALEMEFPLPPLPGDRLWTEPKLEAVVEEAARQLAERARVAIKARLGH